MTSGLRAALREFNAGRFFESHEALEDLLDDAADDDWDLLRGLIQVAVGYHKLTHAYVGGERLLVMGLEKLTSYPDAYAGLDLEALRLGVRGDLERLTAARARGEPPPAPTPPRLLPARTARR